MASEGGDLKANPTNSYRHRGVGNLATMAIIITIISTITTILTIIIITTITIITTIIMEILKGVGRKMYEFQWKYVRGRSG